MHHNSSIILICIAVLAISVGRVGAATVAGQIVVPANVAVAPGDSASFPVTLATAAPANGVFITLTTSDSSTVTVAPANIFIPQGASIPNRAPVVNGIATGSAIITASASGLPPAGGQVQVSSIFIWPPTPPTITSFTAAPATIAAGQAATLTWSVSGAATVGIDNGVGDVSGVTSKSVSPTQTTTYNLTATNSAGSVTARSTITVTTNASAPTITSFTAAPATIAAGQAATLSWSVSGAATVSIDNGVGDVSSVTSKSVSPTQTTTYNLTATNSAGSVTARSTITVSTSVPEQIVVPANVIVGPGESALFPVTLATAAPANGVFITLTSSDSSTVTIAPANIFIPQGATTPNRAPVVNGIVTGSAIITASASGLPPASGQVQVGFISIRPPVPTITSFTSTPATIAAGQAATLSWSVSGAVTVSIDNGVGDVSSVTSRLVSPPTTTTYTLTAANSRGSVSARMTVTVTSGPDTQPPTVPTLVSAVAKSPGEVDLVWTASTDNVGVAGYQIGRNGSVLTPVSGASLSYADTGVSPNTTYTYSIKAYDAAGNYSSPSNTVQVTTPSASTSTIITSCQPITQSGRYVLGANLNAPPNASCINIHDVQGVYLDCQQHGVTIDRRTDPGNDSAIVVTNVRNYSITNCTLTALNTTSAASLVTLLIANSPQGTIANNAFSGGYVTVLGSDNLKIANNTSNAPFSVSGNTQTIEYNTIGLTVSYIVAAVLTLGNSTGSVIQHNVLNGGWDGAVRSGAQAGADDGISAYNVNNTIIQNNTILNTWDCGIENGKPMVNVQILNNQITTAGICGMGGWYGDALRNVTIAGNTVTDAPRLFDYWRADGLYASDGEQFLFFEDNTFSDNKLVKPRVSFIGPWAGRLDFQTLPAGIPANALLAGNNKLTNNDFGPLSNQLRLLPASSVIDGGGNICVPDPTPGFPLRCIPPTPPSGGYYAIAASPAAPIVVAPGALIIVLFGANPGTAGDYIGLAAVGADDRQFLSTRFTGGSASNAFTFTAPAIPGQYELRYMKIGASSHVAASNPITVL